MRRVRRMGFETITVLCSRLADRVSQARGLQLGRATAHSPGQKGHHEVRRQPLPDLLALAPRAGPWALALLGVACTAATAATGCAEQGPDGLEASYPVGSTPPPQESPSEAIDELRPPPEDGPPLPAADAPPASAAPGAPPPDESGYPAQGASVVIGDGDAAQNGELANATGEEGAPPVDEVPPSMQGAPPDSPPDTDPSALNAFRGALDPYGAWVDDPTYGTVWVPSPGAVGPDFTPYETAGRWAYDDSSYVWVSDYSWGWAPFHYGRWVYSRPIGWGWIPGRTYAGAWVSWRSGWDDWAYVGWAPLSPTWCWRRGAAVGLGFVPAAPYAFVSTRDLFATRVATRLVTGSREATVAAHTRPYVAGATTTAGGRTLARPTVGGPSPSSLGIAQSAVVRTPSYRAAARGPSGGAFYGQRGIAGASVGAVPGGMQGESIAPAYGPPVGSHFGGRFGAGFAGTGVSDGSDARAFERRAGLRRHVAELHARRRRRLERRRPRRTTVGTARRARATAGRPAARTSGRAACRRQRRAASRAARRRGCGAAASPWARHRQQPGDTRARAGGGFQGGGGGVIGGGPRGRRVPAGGGAVRSSGGGRGGHR